MSKARPLVKQRPGLRGLIPILKEVLLPVKCYQTASHVTEKSFVNGRVNQFGKIHYCLILRNCHSHPQPSATTTLVSSHQHRGKSLHHQKDYDSLKAQKMVSIF
jgi:hypothetical protein